MLIYFTERKIITRYTDLGQPDYHKEKKHKLAHLSISALLKVSNNTTV